MSAVIKVKKINDIRVIGTTSPKEIHGRERVVPPLPLEESGEPPRENSNPGVACRGEGGGGLYTG